jgi:hypothetical protein
MTRVLTRLELPVMPDEQTLRYLATVKPPFGETMAARWAGCAQGGERSPLSWL